MKGKLLLDTTQGKDMKRGFTLVVCFSRIWCVRPFFEAFNRMLIPMKQCHLIIFDNTDNVILERALMKWAEIYKEAFYTVRLYKSYRAGGGKIMGQDYKPLEESKLPKIYEMYKDILKLISTDVFINFEDDTVCPPHTIMRLLGHMKKFKNNAFISGVEPDRGVTKGVKSRLGVHYIKREGDKILERISLSKYHRGLVDVDATGHYCFITTTKLWRKGWRGIIKRINEIPHFALDMFHTNNLKRAGVILKADFGISCKHMHMRVYKTKPQILYWGKATAVPMLDYYIEKYGVYGQAIPLKKGVRP